MFGIGMQELAVILVVALLIFGPKRLPELARTLGKGLAEFRKASNELRQSFMMEAEPPAQRPPPSPDPRTDEAPVGQPDQLAGSIDESGHGDLADEEEDAAVAEPPAPRPADTSPAPVPGHESPRTRRE